MTKDTSEMDLSPLVLLVFLVVALLLANRDDKKCEAEMATVTTTVDSLRVWAKHPACVWPNPPKVSP